MVLRRLLLPVLAALPVLAVLLALGIWQWQRMAWKTALLAELAAAEQAPPVPLPAAPEPFAKVIVQGRFDHGREVLLGAEVRGTRMGAHLLTPLLRDDAPPLLVDRGWVPVERDTPLERPEGEVAVTGYVRQPDQASWMAAADDPAGRRFFRLDPEAIGRALGLPAPAPFALVALAPPGTPPQLLPAAARALPRPNNPHLGYAITWFGLAAALLAVLAIFLHRRWKDTA